MSKDPNSSPEITVEKSLPAAAATQQEETKKTSIFDKFKLPPWIPANLKSRRSQKIWLRCWVASWVAFVILLPHASLNVLGNAYVKQFFGQLTVILTVEYSAFFAILASLMIPANLPVQLFIFVSAYILNEDQGSYVIQALATMIVGMCLGWGLGSAAMRGALAARDQVLLQSQLQREAQRCVHDFEHRRCHRVIAS